MSLKNILSLLDTNKAKYFSPGANDILRFRNNVCVPEDDELKQMVSFEGHRSIFSLYPYMTKMYQDLRQSYSWPNMKKDVAKFIFT